jgi:hypothetical protein
MMLWDPNHGQKGGYMLQRDKLAVMQEVLGRENLNQDR